MARMRAKASSSTAPKNARSIVFARRHASTARLVLKVQKYRQRRALASKLRFPADEALELELPSHGACQRNERSPRTPPWPTSRSAPPRRPWAFRCRGSTPPGSAEQLAARLNRLSPDLMKRRMLLGRQTQRYMPKMATKGAKSVYKSTPSYSADNLKFFHHLAILSAWTGAQGVVAARKYLGRVGEHPLLNQSLFDSRHLPAIPHQST